MDFNGGATNISLFARYYRDRIKATEDERWYSQDYRQDVSEDDPFYVNALRNTSTYRWFQLDLPGRDVGQSWHASNDGETALADATDPRGGTLCYNFLEQILFTGFGTCMFDNRSWFRILSKC